MIFETSLAVFWIFFKCILNEYSLAQLFTYSAVVISLYASNYENNDAEHCIYNKMVKVSDDRWEGGVGQSVRKCEMGGGGVSNFSKKVSSDI